MKTMKCQNLICIWDLTGGILRNQKVNLLCYTRRWYVFWCEPGHLRKGPFPRAHPRAAHGRGCPRARGQYGRPPAHARIQITRMRNPVPAIISNPSGTGIPFPPWNPRISNTKKESQIGPTFFPKSIQTQEQPKINQVDGLGELGKKIQMLSPGQDPKNFNKTSTCSPRLDLLENKEISH